MACDGDGNFWDPYCPCRVTRKNIVMTFLGIVRFVALFLIQNILPIQFSNLASNWEWDYSLVPIRRQGAIIRHISFI